MPKLIKKIESNIQEPIESIINNKLLIKSSINSGTYINVCNKIFYLQNFYNIISSKLYYFTSYGYKTNNTQITLESIN